MAPRRGRRAFQEENRGVMKRDSKLCIDILNYWCNNPEIVGLWASWDSKENSKEFPKYKEYEVHKHLKILADGGLIVSDGEGGMSGISWKGYDYLDSLKPWNRFKSNVMSILTFSLIMFQIVGFALRLIGI